MALDAPMNTPDSLSGGEGSQQEGGGGSKAKDSRFFIKKPLNALERKKSGMLDEGMFLVFAKILKRRLQLLKGIFMR